MNRHLIVTIIALVVAVVLHWQMNTPGAISEPWNMPRWKWEIGPLVSGLSMVLPGALVGFVAGRNGLLLGALAGFLGHLVGTAHMHFGAEVSSNTFAVLRSALLMPLGHAIVSGCGGGAGQLLRSNKSLERTRGR